MMVKLICSCNLCNLGEAKILSMSTIKRNNDMNKVLTQLCDVSKTGFRLDGNHRFCCAKIDFSKFGQLVNKKTE